VTPLVHLAAENGDHAPPERVMATNLLGTWHVLLAARTAGVRRVVVFSSVTGRPRPHPQRPGG
jgi:UDP-glucose 4-epimerase